MRWEEQYKQTNSHNCDDKRTFNSFREASAFNKRSRRLIRGNKRKENLRVYRCYDCQQWHLGHPPGKAYHKKSKMKRKERKKDIYGAEGI